MTLTEHYYSHKPDVVSNPKFWDFTFKGRTFRFKSDNGVFSKRKLISDRVFWLRVSTLVKLWKEIFSMLVAGMDRSEYRLRQLIPIER